jgi:hypothetical protein
MISNNGRNVNNCCKAKCLHPIIIILYSGAYALYFFSLIAIKKVKLTMGHFGLSFWVGILSIPIFVIIVIYYRRIKLNIIHSDMEQCLLEELNK